MEKKTTHPSLSLNSIKKFTVIVFRSLFENPDKKEFQRLKNFIAS
ncbi:MAG: hypothetical protein V4556_14265 [Bacteroidota bacterium]